MRRSTSAFVGSLSSSLMDDPFAVDFSDARLKVERANSHISDLESQATHFFSRYPYGIRQEADFETERYGYYVTQRRPAPRQFALIVGDAIHNLRAALDYLISAVASAQGKTIKDTHFPFPRTADDLEERLKKDVRKAGPVAMQIVRDLHPYPGGNAALRAIHDLDLIDKHRLVVPVASAMEVTISTGLWNGRPRVDVTGSLYSLDEETQFIPSPAGYETDTPTNMSFAGQIVFARNGPLGGERCISALHDLSETVSDIIGKFEEAFRL